jgi:nitroreductase
MSGIVFMASQQLPLVKEFYAGRLGMEIWLEQADCVLFKHGNLLIGFCRRDRVDTGGMITLFFPGRAEVDEMHRQLGDCATSSPRANETYEIYQFFATDPEGRTVEFQSFDLAVSRFQDGEELLHTRRSVRRFLDRPVDEPTLQAVLDSLRYAPSARNSQPCRFLVVRNRETLERLAALRGDSSQPIARANLAVAVISDPAISGRAMEDGCIAAYHLLLSAWWHGLGTCWIGGMDTDPAKDVLGLSPELHLITVTPLGYPAESPMVRNRRDVRVEQDG